MNVNEKSKEDYTLIPMSEITDTARKLAVAWMECEDKNWIGQKHKLASDIMNYARLHADQETSKLREELENNKYKILMDFYLWIRDEDKFRTTTAHNLITNFLNKKP